MFAVAAYSDNKRTQYHLAVYHSSFVDSRGGLTTCTGLKFNVPL